MFANPITAMIKRQYNLNDSEVQAYLQGREDYERELINYLEERMEYLSKRIRSKSLSQEQRRDAVCKLTELKALIRNT